MLESQRETGNCQKKSWYAVDVEGLLSFYMKYGNHMLCLWEVIVAADFADDINLCGQPFLTPLCAILAPEHLKQEATQTGI